MSQKENKGRGCKVRTNHHAQGLNETSFTKQVRGVPCEICLSSGIHYVWSVTELGKSSTISFQSKTAVTHWSGTTCKRCVIVVTTSNLVKNQSDE